MKTPITFKSVLKYLLVPEFLFHPVVLSERAIGMIDGAVCGLLFLIAVGLWYLALVYPIGWPLGLLGSYFLRHGWSIWPSAAVVLPIGLVMAFYTIFVIWRVMLLVYRIAFKPWFDRKRNEIELRS